MSMGGTFLGVESQSEYKGESKLGTDTLLSVPCCRLTCSHACSIMVDLHPQTVSQNNPSAFVRPQTQVAVVMATRQVTTASSTSVSVMITQRVSDGRVLGRA